MDFELDQVEYSTYSGILTTQSGEQIEIEGEWSIKNPHEPHISHLTAFIGPTDITWLDDVLSLIATELERSSRVEDINQFNMENE